MAAAKISFNINGDPLYAPLFDSQEALLMADNNWLFVQATKEGSGVWIQDYCNNARKSRATIRAKAYVTKNREVTLNPVGHTIAENLSNITAEEWLDLGLSGDLTNGDFQHRCEATEKVDWVCSGPRSWMETDVESFLFSLTRARSKMKQKKKPKTQKFPIIKLF